MNQTLRWSIILLDLCHAILVLMILGKGLTCGSSNIYFIISGIMAIIYIVVHILVFKRYTDYVNVFVRTFPIIIASYMYITILIDKCEASIYNEILKYLIISALLNGIVIMLMLRWVYINPLYDIYLTCNCHITRLDEFIERLDKYGL